MFRRLPIISVSSAQILVVQEVSAVIPSAPAMCGPRDGLSVAVHSASWIDAEVRWWQDIKQATNGPHIETTYAAWAQRAVIETVEKHEVGLDADGFDVGARVGRAQIAAVSVGANFARCAHTVLLALIDIRARAVRRRCRRGRGRRRICRCRRRIFRRSRRRRAG